MKRGLFQEEVAHDPEFLATTTTGTGAGAQLVRRVMQHQMKKKEEERRKQGKGQIKRRRVRKRLPGGKDALDSHTEVILTEEAKADIARRTKIIATQGMLPPVTRGASFMTVCALRMKYTLLAVEAVEKRKENIWQLLYRENPSLFYGRYGFSEPTARYTSS